MEFSNAFLNFPTTPDESATPCGGFFVCAQPSAVARRYDLGMNPDRRQDHTTAATVTEALRMKTAFGLGAAHTLAARRGIAAAVAERTLSTRHDPRQQPS